MTKTRQLLPVFLLMLAALCLSTAQAEGNVGVIVNAANPVGELNRTTVRSIFSMRVRQWPDGTPITVFVLPDRDEQHRRFCTEVLRVYPYVLRDTWDRLVFTGTGQAPVQVASAKELERMVGLVRGAIGYTVDKGSPSRDTDRFVFVSVR